MITMSNFPNNGRLGNQLFQYASLIGIANETGRSLVLPHWDYSQYFKARFPEGELIGRECRETSFNFDTNIHNEVYSSPKIDFNGYFQSEKYWKACEEVVRKQLEFRDDFIDLCKSKFFDLDWNKTIAIHIRRGDYINNPNYYQLPIKYYIMALEGLNFKDYNLMFFSDDIEYCKIHFGCLDNAYFSRGNEIEDLCLMTQCKHFILANSSFSWWGAYLGEKKDSKVIRPKFHFDGKLARECDIKDYYLNDWLVLNHTVGKIDLSDVTFTIPVHYDHEDRMENFKLCIEYLQSNFHCSIIVAEQGSNKMDIFNSVDHINLNSINKFHRTKMLNKMALLAETEIIVNQDCDVFIPPMQMLEAIDKLRNGYDVSYPSDGRFSGIDRIEYYQELRMNLDFGIIHNFKARGNKEGNKYNTVGGVVAFNRSKFIEGGMENENFISYGAEDMERWVRFNKLEYKIIRIRGTLYHLDHFIGINSSAKNPFFDANEIEYQKVNKMSKQELLNYIETWTWKKQLTLTTK